MSKGDDKIFDYVDTTGSLTTDIVDNSPYSYGGIDVLRQPDEDKAEKGNKGSADSPSYNRFSNEKRLRQPIPVVYGRVRQIPDIIENQIPISYYTHNFVSLPTDIKVIFALSLGQVDILERWFGDIKFDANADGVLSWRDFGGDTTDVGSWAVAATTNELSAPATPVKDTLPEITMTERGSTENITIHGLETKDPKLFTIGQYQNTTPAGVELLDLADTELSRAAGWYIINPSGTKVTHINAIVAFPDGAESASTANAGEPNVTVSNNGRNFTVRQAFARNAEIKMVLQKIDDEGRDVEDSSGGFTSSGQKSFSTHLDFLLDTRGSKPVFLFVTFTYPSDITIIPTPNIIVPAGRYKAKFYVKEGTRSSTFGREKPITLLSTQAGLTTSNTPTPFTREPHEPAITDINNLEERVKIYKDITLNKSEYFTESGLFGQEVDKVSYLVNRRLPQLVKEIGSDEIVYEDDLYRLYNRGRTRNPVWALLDVLMNKTYGLGVPLSRIDVEAFYREGRNADARGDYFDFVFDRDLSIDEVIKHITRAARLWLIPHDGLYTLTRDEVKDSPVAIFTNANIVANSFKVKYKMFIDDHADGIEVEFLNEKTWEEDVVTVADTAEPTNLHQVKFTGVTTRDHALREARYLWNVAKHRREQITFSAEAEGLIPKPGDLILVSNDVFFPTQAGTIVDVSATGTLTLSATLPATQPAESQNTVRTETTSFYFGTFNAKIQNLSAFAGYNATIAIPDMGYPIAFNEVVANSFGENISYTLWSARHNFPNFTETAWQAAFGNFHDVLLARFFKSGARVANLLILTRYGRNRHFPADSLYRTLHADSKITLTGLVTLENIVGFQSINEPPDVFGHTPRDTDVAPVPDNLSSVTSSWFALNGRVELLLPNPFSSASSVRRPVTLRLQNIPYNFIGLQYKFTDGSLGTAVDGGDTATTLRNSSGATYSFRIIDVLITSGNIILTTNLSSTAFRNFILGMRNELSIDIINQITGATVSYTHGSVFRITSTNWGASQNNRTYIQILRAGALGVNDHDFRAIFRSSEPQIGVRFRVKRTITENTATTRNKEYIVIKDRQGRPSQKHEILRASETSVSLAGNWTYAQQGDIITATKNTGETLEFYVGKGQEATQCMISRGDKIEKRAIVQSIKASNEFKCKITAVEYDPRIYEGS